MTMTFECQSSVSFWGHNPNTTLFVAFPLFSECAERTVLLWIPCAIFWFFLPLELWRLLNESMCCRKWSRLVKCRVCSLACLPISVIGLLVLTVADKTNRQVSVYWTNVNVASYVILLATTVALIYISVLLQRKACASSPTLWITLFSLSICGAVEMTTTIMDFIQNEKFSPLELAQHTFYCVYYALLLCSLLLHSFSPVNKDQWLDESEADQPLWPERACSFPSRLYFTWFSGIMWQGFRRTLEVKDMFFVSVDEQAEHVHGYFEANLEKEFRDTIEQNRFSWKDSEEEINATATEVCRDCLEPSLLRVLMRSFGISCAGGAVLKLFYDVLMFAEPFFVQVMINFASDSSIPWWHGVLYVVLMAFVILIRAHACQQYFYIMNRVGVRTRTALVAAVYRKALRMTSEARQQSTCGEIVNLMSVDAARFRDAAPFVQMIWSGPFQIALALVYLYYVVGKAVYAAVGVMASIFFVNIVACKFLEKMNIKQMKEKDERIKLMTEVLNAIKVIKLYAWELAFQKRIEGVRARELKHIKKAAYVGAVTQFSWSCSQIMICFAVFFCYGKILTPSVVFTVITISNIMDFPLSVLPMVFSSIATLRVSIKRLNDFFSAQELSEDNDYNDFSLREKNVAVNVENASFTWEADISPSLVDINLHVPRGSLVAVVGKVGSGKSSLLSALCGELHKVAGTVKLNGSLAYASQQSWIQNLTLRENVLFSKPFRQQWYDNVIEACALRTDFSILPCGDLTEIGERGINLSGGQKQRVSLARAVYQNCDIYLLDDPLSAVDSHVGKHIFAKVVGPSGILKDKTRFLVTHGLSFLPLCDLIIVMKNGRIEEVGAFKELLANEGAFAEVVQQYFSDGLSDEELDELKDTAVAELSKFNVCRPTAIVQQATTKQTRQNVPGTPSNGMTLKPASSLSKIHSAESLATVYIKDDDDEDIEDGKLIDNEEMQVGKVSWAMYLNYLRASGPVLLIYLLFVMLTEGCVLASNIWLQIWSDNGDKVLLENSTLSDESVTVEEGLTGYGLIGLIQLIFVTIMVFCYAYFQLRADKVVHSKLLKSIFRAPMSFFDTTPSGRILNRCGKDINTIDNQIPDNIDQVAQFIFLTLAALVGVIYAMPVFAVAVIPGVLLYYLLQRFYVTSSRQFRRLEAVSRSPVYSHFQETLQGVATIRAFRQQNRFMDESNRLIDVNNSLQMGLIVSNRWVGVRLDLISVACVGITSAVVVFLRNHGLTPGTVGLAVSLALSVTEIFSWGVQQTSALETEIVALERITEYSNTPAEAEWDSADKGVSSQWPSAGQIVFENYSTRYRPGLALVLNGLSCLVNPREKIGIVGRTGAGKSSLTLSLFRLIEASEGQILIDGIDVSKLGLHEIRSRLTIIPQEPVLFSGNLRTNLDPFDKYSDDELWHALELSHLKSFVANLPEKLSHQIGEGGANLSLGQRQLICLARAVLRRSKLLILDEATAAVDIETDYLVQETIREHFKDCTVITIAHRINTVMDYDRIMVFDSGRLVEFNTPDVLLAREDSVFSKMVSDSGIVVSY